MKRYITCFILSIAMIFSLISTVLAADTPLISDDDIITNVEQCKIIASQVSHTFFIPKEEEDNVLQINKGKTIAQFRNELLAGLLYDECAQAGQAVVDKMIAEQGLDGIQGNEVNNQRWLAYTEALEDRIETYGSELFTQSLGTDFFIDGLPDALKERILDKLSNSQVLPYSPSDNN